MFLPVNNRPRIALEINTLDRFLILAGFGVIFLMWVYLIWSFGGLPETVAIHFNAEGEADNYGNKAIIIPFAILATLQFAGLEVLTRYPHTFNYPVEIHDGNAREHYALSVRMMRMLNLIICLLFASIVGLMVRSASGGELDPLAPWVITAGVLLVFAPIIWYGLKARHIP